MKSRILVAAAAMTIVGALSASAQSSETRIPVRKDAALSHATHTMPMPDAAIAHPELHDSLMAIEWYRPTPTACTTVDPAAARAVSIKSDMYNAASMISPDSAKIVALCAVPGQIGSGEMELVDGRAHYDIVIIPNGKKTATKVVVDAETGAVLSSKQFGGLRGLAGWVRESIEHSKNKKP